MERLMLKPQEAAEAIGMGRTAFYRLVKARVIPSCRIGKSIRIPVPALRTWVEQQITHGEILTVPTRTSK
jgi:excisionase family DNA binding protein